ncbi:putative G-protein coupled receptor, partial [Apostichopus japonicus]
VQSFLITNLAIGDMCMGIYLLIIAIADLNYRGRYAAYESLWKRSLFCKFAGFLSTFSSELSVLSLTFITLHRVSSIVFPFRTKDIGFSRIVWIMTSTWAIVFFLAGIPLLGFSYFDNFYGRSGVCLALHITPDKPNGWEYAVFVFLALNFFSFTFIAVAYMVMFYVARRTQQAAKRSLRGNKGSDAMARKMTLIVFTDFCCWMPIIILGVASLCGANIHPPVFAWVAVFVLPLNSAVNPLLYTLWTAPYARKIINSARSTFGRSTATTEYKLSANLSTSEKVSSTANGRRRAQRGLASTSNSKLPPEKSTGSIRSSDVINDPEEGIRLHDVSHDKGNVYVNPNNNDDRLGNHGNKDAYEKMLSDKSMDIDGGHSSEEG